MSHEQIQYVALEKITTALQVREHFDEESLQGLAESLKEVGQLQPIRVRKGGDKLVIVDGERRFRAARKAGLAQLAIIIEDKEIGEGAVIQRQLIANCQRDDLTPMEKARGIGSLMEETGWNASEVASKLGMSNAMVSRLLALLALPQSIQEQIVAGNIGASAAIELAKVQDPAKQQDLASQVASGRLTRDGIAKAAKARGRSGSGSGKPPSSRLIAMLGLGRVISIIAPALSLDGIVELLEELLAKARKAKAQSLSVGTFQKLLEDTCRG